MLSKTIISPMFILITINLLTNTKGEVFSSIAKLVEVWKSEEIVIQHLQQLIKSEEQKLELLKMYSKSFGQDHPQIRHNDKLNVEEHLANPITAFKLIKRLVFDLDNIKDLVLDNNGADFLESLAEIKKIMEFPSKEDLTETVMGINRLVDVYDLDQHAFTDGVINGKPYNSKLTSEDCLLLALESYQHEIFYHASQWLKQADRMCYEKENKTSERDNILEIYLSHCNQDQNGAEEASHTEYGILSPHATRIKSSYSDVLQKTRADLKRIENSYTLHENVQKGDHKEKTTLLCQGTRDLPVEEKSKLKCHYISRNNPLLIINPIKVEEMHLNPDIVLFHDVITELETKIIKNNTATKLIRARVVSENGSSVTSFHRIGQMATLPYEERLVKNIRQRFSDVTGLALDDLTAERLGVVNYGVGGHYVPHNDDFDKELNEVDQGGFTVFPELDVIIRPRLGSALFWFNLHPDGTRNPLLLHAACPVLVGSKWVLTQWIRGNGQMFTKPCPTNFTNIHHKDWKYSY